MAVGGEGGAVVKTGWMAEELAPALALDTLCRAGSDGADEEAELLRDIAVREGVESTEVVPNVLPDVCTERGVDRAGETRGPVREGVVEVIAAVVVTEIERVAAGDETTVGDPVALCREDGAPCAGEPGVRAAVVRDDVTVVVDGKLDWMGPVTAKVEGTGDATDTALVPAVVSAALEDEVP